VAQLELLAACAFGLEAVVARELTSLGYESNIIAPGKVLFTGDMAAICRANIWLRSADRVLLRMATFPAADFDALFETTRELDWHHWIAQDAEFPVVGRSIKSQLSSVPAIQRSVKKAIVESLLKAHGCTTLDETGPIHKVEVALLKDEVTLTLDTTGPSLHKRGYRDLSSGAPLKETLAAAMVQLSFWQPDRPFVDPFCGSGTIPIEAAMIARNMAPGVSRTFSAESWQQIPMEMWDAVRERARQEVLPPLSVRIIGTDVDGRVLSLARHHAERAAVSEDIHFQELGFEKLSSKREYGCLITNPPYGQRSSDRDEVQQLYETIPLVLRHLPTWSYFILTSHSNFEKVVGREAYRRRKLYNGRIQCTLFQFHGPKPGTKIENTFEEARQHDPTNPPAASDIDSDVETHVPKEPTVAVFGGLVAKDHEQAELFRSRLTKRARHLRRWPTRQGITCFRIYERDIPEIPLIVDRYEDHLHITEYERPHERDPARHADWLDLMSQTAAQTLDVDKRKVFFKRRDPLSKRRQHDRVAEDQYEVEVQEGGLKLIVNLSDYVDTGLFLDHRNTRSMVRELSDGKRFLNLFAYTGAFSVYAAAGGATETTTVDWSPTYIDWAKRNMSLNGFTSVAHRFVRSDARQFLATGAESEPYDLAVIDPPTFSNSKRSQSDWIVQEHYAELLNTTLRIMNPRGIIFFSTNFRRFKMDESRIESNEIHELSRQTVPLDFRNRRIHRCWRIVK
jgi:23S rRNA (guanine2445-N2)-methyltransferase / 23S rRNA (guanine2069-N7)-methyltransferase